jgi:hypothetical protein
MAMDGSDDEVDRNHDCSKDLIVVALVDFRTGK